MTEREHQQLDEEIVDQERAATLAQIADDAISDLDFARQIETQAAEDEIERQLNKLECERNAADAQERRQ